MATRAGRRETITNVSPGPSARWLAPALGAPWTLYPLVAISSGVILSIVLGSLLPARDFSSIIGAEFAWWVFLALLWYFVLARIPDRVCVRAIRREFPNGTLVWAARSDRSLELWIAQTLRDNFGPRPSQFGIAVVGTTTELQIWMGSAGESIPVAAVGWQDVVSVKPHAGHGARIHILLAPDDLPVDFRIVNPHWFSPVLARGRARDQVIDDLDSCRRARGNRAAYYSQDDSQ